MIALEKLTCNPILATAQLQDEEIHLLLGLSLAITGENYIETIRGRKILIERQTEFLASLLQSNLGELRD